MHTIIFNWHYPILLRFMLLVHGALAIAIQVQINIFFVLTQSWLTGKKKGLATVAWS